MCDRAACANHVHIVQGRAPHAVQGHGGRRGNGGPIGAGVCGRDHGAACAHDEHVGGRGTPNGVPRGGGPCVDGGGGPGFAVVGRSECRVGVADRPNIGGACAPHIIEGRAGADRRLGEELAALASGHARQVCAAGRARRRIGPGRAAHRRVALLARSVIGVGVGGVGGLERPTYVTAVLAVAGHANQAGGTCAQGPGLLALARARRIAAARKSQVDVAGDFVAVYVVELGGKRSGLLLVKTDGLGLVDLGPRQVQGIRPAGPGHKRTEFDLSIGTLKLAPEQFGEAIGVRNHGGKAHRATFGQACDVGAQAQDLEHALRKIRHGRIHIHVVVAGRHRLATHLGGPNHRYRKQNP